MKERNGVAHGEEEQAQAADEEDEERADADDEATPGDEVAADEEAETDEVTRDIVIAAVLPLPPFNLNVFFLHLSSSLECCVFPSLRISSFPLMFCFFLPSASLLPL